MKIFIAVLIYCISKKLLSRSTFAYSRFSAKIQFLCCLTGLKNVWNLGLQIAAKCISDNLSDCNTVDNYFFPLLFYFGLVINVRECAYQVVKKYSFFGKFSELCFLETPALLPTSFFCFCFSILYFTSIQISFIQIYK